VPSALGRRSRHLIAESHQGARGVSLGRPGRRAGWTASQRPTPGSLPRRPSCLRAAVRACATSCGVGVRRACRVTSAARSVSSSRIRRSAGRRSRSTSRLSAAAIVIRSAVAATSVRRPLPRCSRWSQQAGTCSGSSPHRRRPRRPRAGEPVSSARPRACRAPPGSLDAVVFCCSPATRCRRRWRPWRRARRAPRRRRLLTRRGAQVA